MANVNSTSGFKNIPAQSITTGTATALLTPAAGLYSGYPSPLFPAASGLVLVSDPDWQSGNPNAATPTLVNSSVDGNPFRVRLNLLVTTAGAYTFTAKLYKVTQAILFAGTAATVANNTLLATSATYTAGGAGTANMSVDFYFLWDSTSGSLNGTFSTFANDVLTAAAATTQATSVPVTDLNFIPVFTFGTAGANSVVVKEFLIERA